jgi:DNA (cytosine-5)-methyltransferase 1
MTALATGGESFKVVDLFAGPGGLAEGFSAYRCDGRKVFDLALSVEKEESAFKTLRLRAFARQFEDGLPSEYYDYIAGKVRRDTLASRYPGQWAAAEDETKRLELGRPETAHVLDPLLEKIAFQAEGRTVLVGGPPCQAYSLVGRARNKGIPDYNPSADHRHFLYREYIRILGLLRPAAFVMENVKGFLSSRVEGDRIFLRVLEDLKKAGGREDSYRIIPLESGSRGNGTEYLLRSENHGIPQRRHRVILVGVRADLARHNEEVWAGLDLEPEQPTVAHVLRGMPPLRSGLSRDRDSAETWRKTVVATFRQAAAAAYMAEDERFDQIASRLAELAYDLEAGSDVPERISRRPAPVSNNALAAWLVDPKLTLVPNHESRGHMESDLARYAFAATFAEVLGRSPKADEYPVALAPDHRNWKTGKFNDRFRVQLWNAPSTTITSHISKDGHYFIHPDPRQCRSLTVREAARLQTFPDNYFFEGNRTQQYVQVGNAVPPLLANKIAGLVYRSLNRRSDSLGAAA